MKITLRLIVSLVLAAALVAAVSSYIQVGEEGNRMTHELDVRAGVIADGLQESIRVLLQANSPARLKRLVDRFGNRERLVGIAVFDSGGANIAVSAGFPPALLASAGPVWEAMARNENISAYADQDGSRKHLYGVPVHFDGRVLGGLLVLHDASYIESRLDEIWQRNFIRLLTNSFFIILITVLVGATLYFEVFRYMNQDNKRIEGSGTIEVTEIEISSKIAGRVAELAAEM